MGTIPWVRRIVAASARPWEALRDVDPMGPALSSIASTLRVLDRRATSRAFEPFDQLECEVVRALAEAMCVTDGEDMVAPDLDALVGDVEARAMALPRSRATRLRDLLLVLEYEPLAAGTRRARFTELTPTERAERLHAWQTSAIAGRRAGYVALHRLVMLAWWSRSDNWAVIGMDEAAERNAEAAQ